MNPGGDSKALTARKGPPSPHSPSVNILRKELFWESIEILKNKNNFNRDDSYPLNRCWLPVLENNEGGSGKNPLENPPILERLTGSEQPPARIPYSENMKKEEGERRKKEKRTRLYLHRKCKNV